MTATRTALPKSHAPTLPVAPIIESHPDSEHAADLGEGAPGADGSRRWRGRRGRRGRDTREPNLQAATPVEAPREPTGPITDAYDAPFDPVSDFATPEPLQSDRGDRNDRSDRGNRGDRSRRDRPAPRVPRGFAPSTSLYQVDGSAEAAPYGSDDDQSAPIEPIILPGESLRKYRAPEENAAPTTPPPTPSAPAQEFVAAGWDGGAVLPGETIRPRTPSSSSSTSDAPSRGRDDRGGRDSRGGRDDRGRDRNRNDRGGNRDHRSRDDRGPRPDSRPDSRPARFQQPQQFTPPVAAPAHEPIPEPIPEPIHAHAEPTPISTTAVPPPPFPTQQEYEPSDASASYRIDPVPPSQFVQPAPEVEEVETQEEEQAINYETIPNLIPELMAAPEPQQPQHDVTSISATGDMHSEPHPQPPAEQAAHEQAPYFAPGAGLLEEEEFLDEEDEIPSLQAHSYADVAEQQQEQHEQETLENAADLGSMIREMSIDQITRTQAPDDEDEDDDDLEEDFLEEDQDYEESDEDDSEESISEDHSGEDSEDGSEEGVDEPFLGDDVPLNDEFASAEPRSTSAEPAREPRRDRDRGDRGRRDSRRGDRNRRPSGDRDRSGGNAASDRTPSSDRGRRDGGRGRQSMQSTNLPAISDLLKPGQEILVQIAKEPIAKKGARITSHIALPGRFLVFMPTVSHTGVSRKIESDTERRRLKEILLSERGEAAGGFIVRTAAAGATEEELRSDLRFLLNLWADIKARSEASKSPALIYHDLNLIERVLRDQVTDNFSAIWVDTETEYERVLRFLQRFQPSLIRRVKLYTKETPLFEQFGITEEINKALRSKVWLKSGGSIVINQTEALVAIDINTGKFVGKTARLEDTIVKTNLDAIPEIVRQIRLRDLGGIIIIDFIDMDERKNRNKVMAALEEELKIRPRPFQGSPVQRLRPRRHHPQARQAVARAHPLHHLRRLRRHRHGQIPHHRLQRHLHRDAQDAQASRPRRRHAARPPRGRQAAQIHLRPLAAGDGGDGRQDHPRQERSQPPPRAVRHPLNRISHCTTVNQPQPSFWRSQNPRICLLDYLDRVPHSSRLYRDEWVHRGTRAPPPALHPFPSSIRLSRAGQIL